MRHTDSDEPTGLSDLSMAEQYDFLSRPVTRRAVLRGGVIGLGAAMLGPGLVACSTSGRAHPSAGPSRYPPGGRHLSFGSDPSTQMRVAWQVASPVQQPFIRLGSVDGDLGRPMAAQVRPLVTRIAALGAAYTQYYVHAELDGLTPDTVYTYAVGHRGFSDASWLRSSLSTFRTGPASTHAARPFRFTAFGDQGTNRHGAASTALVGRQQPAFHLLAGDISYADSTGRGHPPARFQDAAHDKFQPRIWNRYLTQIDHVARTVPWMVTAGNHDMEPAYSAHGYGGLEERFLLPQNGPRSCPTVYSFVYGNVGVVSLDANDVSFEIHANLGYSGGRQTAWLSKELAALRRNPRVDFIVVFFHHCAYCTGRTHGSEGGVRQEWVPLFDQHRVDLVINGHNHVYERTDPLRGGVVTTAAPSGAIVRPDTDGTTYLTVGSGGRDVAHFPAAESYAGRPSSIDSIRTQVWNDVRSLDHQDVGWSRTRYGGFAVLAVDVSPAPLGQVSRMTIKTLTTTGREIDRLELHRTAGRQ